MFFFVVLIHTYFIFWRNYYYYFERYCNYLFNLTIHDFFHFFYNPCCFISLTYSHSPSQQKKKSYSNSPIITIHNVFSLNSFFFNIKKKQYFFFVRNQNGIYLQQRWTFLRTRCTRTSTPMNNLSYTVITMKRSVDTQTKQRVRPPSLRAVHKSGIISF
jgi:hypothetical protein